MSGTTQRLANDQAANEQILTLVAWLQVQSTDVEVTSPVVQPLVSQSSVVKFQKAHTSWEVDMPAVRVTLNVKRMGSVKSSTTVFCSEKLNTLDTLEAVPTKGLLP